VQEDIVPAFVYSGRESSIHELHEPHPDRRLIDNLTVDKFGFGIFMDKSTVHPPLFSFCIQEHIRIEHIRMMPNAQSFARHHAIYLPDTSSPPPLVPSRGRNAEGLPFFGCYVDA
jgi:hypothetical protein